MGNIPVLHVRAVLSPRRDGLAWLSLQNFNGLLKEQWGIWAE